MTLDIAAFKSVRVMVIGDLMIDEYLWGDVDRISPEAPVPIVAVKRESYTLGGAGNVVSNLVAMGAAVSVTGTAGPGPTGELLLKRFAEIGVDTRGICVEPDRPTTRKTRVIASNQQVLRIDRETRREISPFTMDTLTRHLEATLPHVDLVLISDYDKGLVTRSLVAIVARLAARHSILAIADPKGLDYTKYSRLNMLTPNQKEAGMAASIEIFSPADLEKAGRIIMDKAELERLIITCGKDGMLLFDHQAPVRHIESEARQVFDVSGAGDTVIAILGLALASGASFLESAICANAAAGIVVGKVGTATPTIPELTRALGKTQVSP
ncbi:MAG: D-glycero-beta-D-manno-heptose-7-phosphate kinase [Pseudomonadota bacterium]